jgi:pyruvate dehydrogenase E2 component (dihydrolipoamide acetyltransferase)
MATVEVKAPDIGDFKDVEIIEVLVKPGDRIKAEQSLVTVESDKASMEIPSSAAGVVKELRVKLGDKISEGSLLLLLESEGGAEPAPAPAAAAAATPAPAAAAPSPAPVAAPAAVPAAAAGPIELVVPDIGDFDEVSVIEVLVKPGDSVAAEQNLITVERQGVDGDPSSHAGWCRRSRSRSATRCPRAARSRPCRRRGRRAGSGCGFARPVAGRAGAGRSRRLPPPGEKAADGGAARARAERTAGALPHLADDQEARPRARRAAGRGQRQRTEGPHHPGRRPGLRQGGDGWNEGHPGPGGEGAGRRCGRWRRRLPRPAGLAAGRLRQVRADREEGAVADQEDQRPGAAPQLGRDHVTNHDDADITELEAFRVTTNKENGERRQGDARLPDQGLVAAAEVPEFNASLEATIWC